jgi:hypothetical protein
MLKLLVLIPLFLFPAVAQAVTSVDVSSLIVDVVWIIVIGIIFWLLFWLIDYCGIPEPFNKVIKVVVAVVAVLILINFLLGLAGHQVVAWH